MLPSTEDLLYEVRMAWNPPWKALQGYEACCKALGIQDNFRPLYAAMPYVIGYKALDITGLTVGQAVVASGLLPSMGAVKRHTGGLWVNGDPVKATERLPDGLEGPLWDVFVLLQIRKNDGMVLVPPPMERLLGLK